MDSSRGTNNKMDQLSDMRVFCQIVDCGSLAQASRVLGLAPATVTGALARVEKRLGVRLLERTTRKLSVTEAGRLWYGYARQIVEQSDEAEDAVRSLSAEPRGHLRVALPLGVAMRFIYPYLSEFSEHYPAVTLDLQVSDRIVDLVANGFDLALRAGHPGDSDFVVKPLLRYRRLACASPAYLAQHGTPRKPSDLGSHHCLLYRHEPQSSSWSFRVDGATVAVPVNCSFSSNESHALLTWARSGMGITLQPDWLVDDDLRSGRLIAVLDKYGIRNSRELPAIYAVLLKSRNQPKKVEAFVRFFGEKIQATANAISKKLPAPGS